MGCGSWSPSSFKSYVNTSRGMSLDEFTTGDFTNKQIFKSTKIHEDLVPINVMRECCDNEEHPETVPVILALDVTGSMGKAAVKVAQKLNDIMTKLYENNAVKDIEFCIMGIGDLEYDNSPIQISQFESDIRIAAHLDKLWFEFGGGGNTYESYTAAWYMGLKHCKLDCWKRGKKGIIITMGDELPNPILYKRELCLETGDKLQDNITTENLYKEASEKFDIYHISVDDYDSSYRFNNRRGTGSLVDDKWIELLEDNYKVATLDNLSSTITDIIINAVKAQTDTVSFVPDNVINNIFGEVPEDVKVAW